MSTEQRFEMWAIVELMGHRRLAGFVREEEIAGRGFIRLDVPCEPPATQYYGPQAIYCITPTTEELARKMAVGIRPAPVHRYELPPETSPSVVPYEVRTASVDPPGYEVDDEDDRDDGDDQPEAW